MGPPEGRLCPRIRVEFSTRFRSRSTVGSFGIPRNRSEKFYIFEQVDLRRLSHKVLQPAPTTKRRKEAVEPIEVVHWRDGHGTVRRSRSDLALVQRQVLLLVRVDSRRFTRIPSQP